MAYILFFLLAIFCIKQYYALEERNIRIFWEELIVLTGCLGVNQT
jgi:hypothetical protein